MTCENEEASRQGEEFMDVDIVDVTNGCIAQTRKNGLLLRPVSPLEEGEGLPYAPVNWPEQGDIWSWRVGKRVASSGNYLDRYLYPPPRFRSRKRDGFKSKLSVEQYIKARFPNFDVSGFFSSFRWKIPSVQFYLLKDERSSFSVSLEEIEEQSPSLSGVGCKAGNTWCSSLTDQTSSSLIPAQSCDICCCEPGFCRDCCCILCCKSIDLAFGGYSFIRCEATVCDDLICGHVAHINCALRAYMTGTVGGSIGLDTEYYCRRCDSQTNLTNHIMSLLKTCESIDSRENIEKILNVGVCLLRGSQKKDSQKLLNHIESILQKVKAGCALEDVWKVRLDIVTNSSGQMDNGNLSFREILYENECTKLEMELLQALEMLKSAQKVEFRIVEDRLNKQKDRICNIYKLQNKEKAELKFPTPSSNRDALLRSIAAREKLIEHEICKFRDMQKVVGKTPKEVMKD